MSWKTQYVSGDVLELINADLKEKGYLPTGGGYAANISNDYFGGIDDVLKSRLSMSDDDVQMEASNMRFLARVGFGSDC